MYGEADLPATTAQWRRHRVAPTRLEGEIRSALTKASAHARSDEEALALFRAEGDALDALCRVADDLRAEAVGDDVTYVINRNINFTNVCYVGCRFCAFAQREVDEESYTLTLTQVADRAEEAWDRGATEVCMQEASIPTSRLLLSRRGRRREAPDPVDARARVQPDGDPHGATKLDVSFAEFLRSEGSRPRHDPGHGGRDPRR